MSAVKNLFFNTFGWQGRFAYNLWLDIARVSGIYALIPFLIATFINIKKCFKLFVGTDSVLGILLVGLNVSFFVSSIVEPVIEGSIFYFSLYMLLWGITSAITKNIQLKKS